MTRRKTNWRFVFAMAVCALVLSPAAELIHYCIDNFPPDFRFDWDTGYFLFFAALDLPLWALIGAASAFGGRLAQNFRPIVPLRRRAKAAIGAGVASAACCALVALVAFDNGSWLVVSGIVIAFMATCAWFLFDPRIVATRWLSDESRSTMKR